MLKRVSFDIDKTINEAAAFGRLCVETMSDRWDLPERNAAAFGRLCVETKITLVSKPILSNAAAFGRLCVETSN